MCYSVAHLQVIGDLEDQVRGLEVELKGVAIEHRKQLESKERQLLKEKDTAVRINEAAVSDEYNHTLLTLFIKCIAMPTNTHFFVLHS